MTNNHNIYKICASSCGVLATYPLDLLQTKIIANQDITIKKEELLWLILLANVFAIRNNTYIMLNFLQNEILRGTLSGLSGVPLYLFIEIKKLYSRLAIYPNMQNFIFYMTIREALICLTIYKLRLMNIYYPNFTSSLIANIIGFPIKLIAFKSGFSTIIFDNSSIKKIAVLEIFKTSIRDALILYLMYDFNYSPFKIDKR